MIFTLGDLKLHFQTVCANRLRSAPKSNYYLSTDFYFSSEFHTGSSFSATLTLQAIKQNHFFTGRSSTMHVCSFLIVSLGIFTRSTSYRIALRYLVL